MIVCAVSYLNTVPLVWGLQHGPDAGRFDLIFRNPSECAALVESGSAALGLAPCFALTQNDWGYLPSVGIASRGPVRSILLVSKVPVRRIRTLAADSSSRSSVAMTRIVLRDRYGVDPDVVPHAPDLERMLRAADAALVIGDPALRLPLEMPGREVLDMGAEWTAATGLPMVYAVWCGPRANLTPELDEVFRGSLRAGLAAMDEIVERESTARGFDARTVRDYLTRNIVFELGRDETRGMELYLERARSLPAPALRAAPGCE